MNLTRENAALLLRAYMELLNSTDDRDVELRDQIIVALSLYLMLADSLRDAVSRLGSDTTVLSRAITLAVIDGDPPLDARGLLQSAQKIVEARVTARMRQFVTRAKGIFDGDWPPDWSDTILQRCRVRLPDAYSTLEDLAARHMALLQPIHEAWKSVQAALIKNEDPNGKVTIHLTGEAYANYCSLDGSTGFAHALADVVQNHFNASCTPQQRLELLNRVRKETGAGEWPAEPERTEKYPLVRTMLLEKYSEYAGKIAQYCKSVADADWALYLDTARDAFVDAALEFDPRLGKFADRLSARVRGNVIAAMSKDNNWDSEDARQYRTVREAELTLFSLGRAPSADWVYLFCNAARLLQLVRDDVVTADEVVGMLNRVERLAAARGLSRDVDAVLGMVRARVKEAIDSSRAISSEVADLAARLAGPEEANSPTAQQILSKAFPHAITLDRVQRILAGRPISLNQPGNTEDSDPLEERIAAPGDFDTNRSRVVANMDVLRALVLAHAHDHLKWSFEQLAGAVASGQDPHGRQPWSAKHPRGFPDDSSLLTWAGVRNRCFVPTAEWGTPEVLKQFYERSSAAALEHFKERVLPHLKQDELAALMVAHARDDLNWSFGQLGRAVATGKEPPGCRPWSAEHPLGFLDDSSLQSWEGVLSRCFAPPEEWSSAAALRQLYTRVLPTLDYRRSWAEEHL